MLRHAKLTNKKTHNENHKSTGIEDFIQQCETCGHPIHEKNKCSVGLNQFTPHVDGTYVQRNCFCPEQ